MREQIQKPQQESRTIQSKTKAANQASIEQILQMYRAQSTNKPVQREGFDEEELLQGKFNTVQREEFDEDELLQGKFDPVQREAFDEDELLQGKFQSSSNTAQREEIPSLGGEGGMGAERINKTGLPDNLKSGIENTSGYSMDDVRVHYNSSKPAQLQALAYTQGTDIHVAPGQEQHLPHEAWHVVQQKQGRVQPTMQLQGVNINDNEGLEKEADVMGKSLNKSTLNTHTVLQTSNMKFNSLQFQLDDFDINGILNNNNMNPQVRAEIMNIYNAHLNHMNYGNNNMGGGAHIQGAQPGITIVGRRGLLSRLWRRYISRQDNDNDILRQSVVVHELTHLAQAQSNNPGFVGLNIQNLQGLQNAMTPDPQLINQDDMIDDILTLNNTLLNELQYQQYQLPNGNNLQHWIGLRLFYASNQQNGTREFPAVINELYYLLGRINNGNFVNTNFFQDIQVIALALNLGR